jgi:hypothetical protein
MTEQEWIEGTDPDVMLDFMFEKASHRKIELYTSGCYRTVGHLLPDERCRQKLDMRDRYFDGLATAAELDSAIRAADDIPHQVWLAAWDSIPPQRHVQILQDLFGNPFRPARLAPSCLTPTVVVLAQEIYDSYAFDRLPDLADALEEAGCDNQEILNHCRASRPHVRGCWVVDLVLGKEQTFVSTEGPPPYTRRGNSMVRSESAAPKEKVYRVQYNDCCNFVTGVVPQGEQVLIGVVGQEPFHVVAAFFDKSGCFLREESRRVEQRAPSHAHREEDQTKALWDVLEAWKEEIRLVPNEVTIRKFHLPKWDNWGAGIGMFELPQFMQDCADDPSSVKDEQFRQELLDDIDWFRNKGKYVLRWGTEYWMSKEGQITDT